MTFRLVDSLPKSQLNELTSLRHELTKKLEASPEMSRSEQGTLWKEHARIVLQKSEAWLDQGYGSCLLRDASNRGVVEDALRYFHMNRQETGAFVVMPNHVHALLRPLGDFSLEQVLKSIKRESSRKINSATGSSGALWQEESYDRIVREPEHLWRCLQYIGRNPAKAKLEQGEQMRWVCESWRNQGWEFIDEDS